MGKSLTETGTRGMPFVPGTRDRGDGTYETKDPEAVFHTKLFKHIKHMSEETKQTIESVSKEWSSIQEVMDFAVNHVKQAWTEAHETGPKCLAEIRNLRMTLTSETRMLKQAMTDVDELLNGEESKRRFNVMRDLVELCERFKAVEQSGAFDAVIRTIIAKP